MGGVFVVENRSRESTMSDVTSAEVVFFWREAGPERWFGKDEGFDLTIATRFMALHEAAARGELAAWEESAPQETPRGSLFVCGPETSCGQRDRRASHQREKRAHLID